MLISAQTKSLISRVNCGLYSRKKLKSDLDGELIHNKTEAIISRNDMKKPLQSLVQQIFRNNKFKNSFNKYSDYQKNKSKDNFVIQNNKYFMKKYNNSATLNFDDINLDLGLHKSLTNKRQISYEKNKNYKKIGINNIYLGHNKTLSERKLSTKNKIYHYLIKGKEKIIDNNSIINTNINDDKNLSLISNNVFNNNTFNTTVNYFNFNNENNNSNDNKTNNIEKIKDGFSTKDLKGINNITLLLNINNLYFLENKLKKIIENLNDYQYCDNECFSLINYYFNNRLYDEFLKLFKNKHNKLNELNQIKIEIICIFLCYDISNSSYYNQTAILLKTIIEIIYSNYLVIISFMK